jgi:hypothetical protein
VLAYKGWDGNDFADLLCFMSDVDNAERFAKYWPQDKTVEINHELN